MKGNIRRIYSVFDGNSKQLIIPVYQRNYDWGESQCRRLFDDLVDVVRHGRDTHFFGAVVGNPEDSFTYVIIDGQQRLTTTSLLMLALVDSIESGVVTVDRDQDLARKIRANYLVLADQDDDVKFKLKPVKNDNDAYRRVVSGHDHLLEDSSVTANYRYFMNRIAKGELSGDELWKAIQSLEVMVLDLERDDDPQRIFESLNSTGLELSEADKIRNIVLMGLPAKDQERLYEDFWNQIEEDAEYQTTSFIRDYLISRTRKTPRKDRLYDAFRDYVSVTGSSVEQILDDMRAYARVARQLKTAMTGYAAADRRLGRFNLMKRDVALPFLMPVTLDVANGVLTADDLSRVVGLVDVFIYRRFVCEVQTSGLNKIFATLYGDVRRLMRGDDDFVSALTYLITSRDSGSSRFPTDAVFREAFATRNFYKIPSATRGYTFECLENVESNDSRDIATRLGNQELSVEHIMPQTLTQQWRADLGEDAEEIHSTWLNRIGNLTVTGYNSAYSNSSFATKKSSEDGFDATPYRLNAEMREVSTWTVADMQRRGERLADIAVDYWSVAPTTFEPAVEPMPVEPMGEEGSFRNRTITAFEFAGVHRTVTSWSDMMTDVVRLVASDHRERVFAAATSGHVQGLAAGETPPKYYTEVMPGLHANTQNSTDARVQILRRLFDVLDIDPDELVFVLSSRVASTSAAAVETPTGPYASLTKFAEPLRAFVGSTVTLADTGEIREEFLNAFHDFRDPDPLTTLDGRGLPGVATSEFTGTCSAAQGIAVLTMLVQFEQIAPGQIHSNIVEGTVNRLLDRLG